MATSSMNVLVFFLCVCNISAENAFDIWCRNRITWDTAKSCCMSAGEKLPQVSNVTVLQSLAAKVRKKGWRSVWLSYRKEILDDWTWVDGSIDVHVQATNESCVYYDQESHRLVPTTCDDVHIMGHICEISECDGCQLLGVKGESCLMRPPRKCFITICSYLTWHQARRQCIARGWDLARMKSPWDLQMLKGQHFRCGKLWVGLRREEWVSDEGIMDNTSYSLWPYDIAMQSGKCTVLNVGHQEYLVSAPCLSKRKHTCEMLPEAIFSSCQNKVAWQTAVACCGSATLPLAENLTRLNEEVNRSESTTLWLGYKWTSFENWIWVDGSIERKVEASFDQSCAYYDRSSRDLQPTSCNDISVQGHICEIKACSDCKQLGPRSLACISNGHLCFLFLCNFDSWHKSRSHCVTRGWDLATVKSSWISQVLGRGDWGCDKFWVGLRREDWSSHNGPMDAKTYSLFSENTKMRAGKCVILDKSQPGRLGSSSCRNKNDYICQRGNMITAEMRDSTIPATSEDDYGALYGRETPLSTTAKDFVMPTGIDWQLGKIYISVCGLIGVTLFAYFIYMMCKKAEPNLNIETEG